MQKSHRHDYIETGKFEKVTATVESVVDFVTGLGLSVVLLGLVVLAALSV